MYLRKLPINLLWLRVGRGLTTLFPSVGIENAGPLLVRNRQIPLKIIYNINIINEDKVENLLKEVQRELIYNFRVTPIDISWERVDGNITEEIESIACEDSRKPGYRRPFYVIITKKGAKDDPGSAYYRIKKVLISHNILSQIVTTETLTDPRKMSKITFRNIALGIFVKIDNIPWYLQKPITLEEESKETIIIGVGITSLKRDVFSREAYRYVGYFSFYNSLGVWKRLRPLFSSLDEIEERIRQSLIDGINQTVSEQVDKLDVIIHYSGKDVRKSEEEIILNTLAEYAMETGIEVNYAIVRLIKSPVYRLFSTHNYGYAPMGTYVDFENNLVLINTTGLLGRRATPIGVNTPILASIRDTNLDVNPQFVHKIVYSVVGLSRMNWRGVNAFNFEPATTKYAREIAYILARLGNEIYQKQEVLRFIQDKMWFI